MKSNFNNEMTDEQVKSLTVTFRELVSEEDWKAIDDMRLRLHEEGYDEIEVKLINSLTENELKLYHDWDEKTFGNTAVQMDDDSDFIITDEASDYTDKGWDLL